MAKIHTWGGAQGAWPRLVWLEQRASAAYWTERWQANPLPRLIADARQHRVLRDLFLKYTSVGGLVLEGGCGRGQWLVVLGEHGRRVVGVDFAQDTLHETKDACPPLELAATDVRHLPFADGLFDTYISLGVAEHFPAGPQPLLDEARRVLRRGGYLLISVPYFGPLRRLRARTGVYRALPSAHLPEDFYQFAFRPAEFGRFLQDNGFAVEAVVPFATMHGLQDIGIARKLGTATKAATATAGDGGTAPAPRGGTRRGAKAALRGVGGWAVNSLPARWFTGHMMLFVARAE